MSWSFRKVEKPEPLVDIPFPVSIYVVAVAADGTELTRTDLGVVLHDITQTVHFSEQEFSLEYS